jgi:hypothetical protein
VVIVAAVAAGFGLFGTGVHGLTQLDGELADGAGRSAPVIRDVKHELGPKGDCPWRGRRYQERYQQRL